MGSDAFHMYSPADFESLKRGHLNVAVAGTPQPLVSLSLDTVPCHEVFMQAKSTNTGRIFIGGDAGLTTAEDGGVWISANQSIRITAQRLQDIWINATVVGDGVSYIYW